MTKTMDEMLEFLRSFIAGGVNQDFKPWARELYKKLYRAPDEPGDDRVRRLEEVLLHANTVLIHMGCNHGVLEEIKKVMQRRSERTEPNRKR